MEKDRSSKVLSIIALVVAAIGTSIGFAAFSSTLVIRSSAEVAAPEDRDLEVIFTSDETGATNDIEAVATGVDGATGTDAEIDNENEANPVIKNLHASFTAPGQEVSWSFFAKNNGDYTAYRKTITYAPAEAGGSVNLVCKAKDQTITDVAKGYIARACEKITVTVNVDGDTGTGPFTNKGLASGAYEPITVTIKYDAQAVEALDAFDVLIGDISIFYNAID